MDKIYNFLQIILVPVFMVTGDLLARVTDELWMG